MIMGELALCPDRGSGIFPHFSDIEISGTEVFPIIPYSYRLLKNLFPFLLHFLHGHLFFGWLRP